MKTFLKVALYSAATAGAAYVGWRVVRAGTPPSSTPPPSSPSGAREATSTNGDFEPAGSAGNLTSEQREELLEELEDQLGV